MEIGAYTLEKWGERQTLRYIDELETCCRQLAENPQSGRSCDHVRPGLRRMEHARHVVFYRIESGGHNGQIPEIKHDALKLALHHLLTAATIPSKIIGVIEEEFCMTLMLPPELESRVAQRARAEGVSSEAYIERLVREATAPPARDAPPLPTWSGYALSALRREDLYDDAP